MSEVIEYGVDKNEYRWTEYGEALRQENENLKKQLEEANGVIEFYGDKTSWKRSQGEDIAREIIAEDCSNVPGFAEFTGGKMARNYLEKYRTKEDV